MHKVVTALPYWERVDVHKTHFKAAIKHIKRKSLSQMGFKNGTYRGHKVASGRCTLHLMTECLL